MARSTKGSTASSCRAPTSIRANMSRAGSERLRWLTGFAGSAGVALILRERAHHLRRRPLHAAGARPGRPVDLHAREPGRHAAAGLDRARTSARARASASIRGCTPSATPRRCARRPTRSAPSWCRSTAIRSTALWTDRPAPPLAQDRDPADRLCRRARQGQAGAAGRRARRGRRRAHRAHRSVVGRLGLQHPRQRRAAHAAGAGLRHPRRRTDRICCSSTSAS